MNFIYGSAMRKTVDCAFIQIIFIKNEQFVSQWFKINGKI